MDDIRELIIQAKGKQGVEADALYVEVYSKFEALSSTQSEGTTQEEVLGEWAEAIASQYENQLQYGKSSNKGSKMLFDAATKKFEEACGSSLSSDNRHVLLYNWGNLLYTKGADEKKRGKKEEADESFTEARSKYDKALEIKDNYQDALLALSRCLSSQGELKDGNQKFWFVSQAAEKEKVLANLKAGQPAGATASLTPENKLIKANEAKEKGNESFKQGDLVGALRNWYNALNMINGAYGFSTKQEQTAKDMKLAVLNNMANVHIKQAKYDRAIEKLNQVLTLDPNNTKGLFRRGRSYLANNDIEKARQDLLRAQKLAPDDKDIKNELILLEKKEKLQDSKQKQFYSKMF